MRAQYVNESIRFGKSKYEKHKLSNYDFVYAGEDGLLGDRGVLIPWKVVKQLLKKYQED